MSSSNESDPYLLPRDDIEFERLNRQHVLLMKRIYENRLLFDEAVKLGGNDCVLDAGAGTCAWALALSKEVPKSVQIYATDISAANFPPSVTTLSNVHLSTASSTSFPREWSNKFSFVHQRLLYGGLRANEWPVALSEIFRILKPGAAVQLMEARLPEPKGPAMAKFTTLAIELFERRDISYDIALHLDRLVADAGFTEMSVIMKDLPVGRKWGEPGDEGLEDVKILKGGLMNMASAFQKEGLVQNDAEYNALLDEMEEDWDEYGAKFDICLVTARKPVDGGAKK